MNIYEDQVWITRDVFDRLFRYETALRQIRSHLDSYDALLEKDFANLYDPDDCLYCIRRILENANL